VSGASTARWCGRAGSMGHPSAGAGRSWRRRGGYGQRGRECLERAGV
jgi:hypothetical protein